MTCLAEQVPTTARDMLVERGGDDGRANVARATIVVTGTGTWVDD